MNEARKQSASGPRHGLRSRSEIALGCGAGSFCVRQWGVKIFSARAARLYSPFLQLSSTTQPIRAGRATRILIFYAAVTAAAVMWGALRGHANILLREPAGYSAAQAVSSLAFGAALGLVLVLVTRELSARYTWARALHNEFRDVLGPLSGSEILLLALASAVGEECLFRGALLLHLSAISSGGVGLVLSVITSAAVFALLHIGPGVRFLPWTLSSLIVGILLGGLAVYTGDLFGAIVAHFTVNVLNLRDIAQRRLSL